MAEQQNEEILERRTGVKIPTPWGPIEVRGLGTILGLTFVMVTLTAWGLFILRQELREDHKEQAQATKQVEERVAEQTYVLTLPQEKRERLDLQMPPSLRNKLYRAREDR